MAFCTVAFCPSGLLTGGLLTGGLLSQWPFLWTPRVMGLSSSEDPIILALVVLTQCQTETDRRTDGFTMASTALSIASYADAL